MNEKPTNALVQAKRTVRDLIDSEKTKLEISRVLPKHLTPERMTRVALTALMKNPLLLDCTPASLMNSLMICSQAGLEPDGRLAHLIPYKTTCQVIFDYKGLIALALRNGMESLYGDKVCANDTFEAWVENGEKKILHKVNWGKPRGTTIAYYVVTKRGGVIDWEVMTIDEVEEIVVDAAELVDLGIEFAIDGIQLLIDGLDFFLGGLQLLVGRLQLFVDRQDLFVGGLELFGGGFIFVDG